MYDWQVITNNIRASYKSLHCVAREIKADASHLGHLSRGYVQQPRFNTGLELLKMHYTHCREKHLKMGLPNPTLFKK